MNKKIFSSVIGGLALLAISFGANALVITSPILINGKADFSDEDTLVFTDQVASGKIDSTSLSGWNATVSSLSVPVNSAISSLWEVKQGGSSYKFDLNSIIDFSDTKNDYTRTVVLLGNGVVYDGSSNVEASFFLSAQFFKQGGNWVGSNSTVTVNTVPLPAAAWLFGSALLGLVGIARRRQSSSV